MKNSRRRSMKVECLEIRQCFAIDIGNLLASLDVPQDVIEIVRHNYQQPTDVNVDGYTSALDALSVINELNLGVDALSEKAMEDTMADTNGDSVISPLDALVVINYLNQPSTGTNNTDQKLTVSVLEGTEATDVQIDEVIRQLMAASPWKLEIIAALGLDSVDPSDQVPGTQDPKTRDPGLLDTGSLYSGSIDGSQVRPIVGHTYDPTDDNGNGAFLSAEDAQPLSSTIEAELRRQLKLDETALVKVAVYQNGGETQSGTWRYLTEEGISIWGNWRLPAQSPEDLRLFLSNVEEENRIYGQYPDGSFLYFSWLDEGPVGFYFTPINGSAVANPVPLEKYTDYFAGVPGAEAYGSDVYGLDAFAGDMGVFAGAQPIENLLSDLFAIQLAWNDELTAGR